MLTKIRTLARGWLNRRVQRLYPQMFADRSDLLRAAKEIGEKLKASRHECEEWRQRAFSAEDQLRAVRKATTDCIRAHNEKSGTIIPTWD